MHINDKYGHSVGDEVLKQFAEHLQNTFRFCGSVGRIGGDEFAVMLDMNLSPDQLEHLLTQFLRDISGILEQVTVSCSIGAYRFVFPQEIKHLLTETDLVYQAKENGRACFVIEDSTPKVNYKSPHSVKQLCGFLCLFDEKRHVNSCSCTPFCQKRAAMGQMKTTAFVVVGCFARADCPHGRPDQNRSSRHAVRRFARVSRDRGAAE